MSDFEDANPFGDDNDHLQSPSSPSVPTLSTATVPDDDERDREPPPPPVRLPQHRQYPGLQPKTGFCCSRDEYLHSGDDAEIQIVDALKMTDHTSSVYIAYVIRTGASEARRRYSEFESLRTGLTKLYPTLIIPPIPSKQSIGDYAIKQSKAKEDMTMISQRKRMLQAFLNRIARHPIISNEHVFHRFLDGEASWIEVLHSPPLSLVPKNILKAPAHNPTELDMSPAYAALPSPSPAHPLRVPDQRFLDSETFTNKFSSHLGGNMEKVARRTMKRWSEYSQDHAELGAILNGFSLSEQGQLSAAIEKTGQAVDVTYMSTTKLLQEWEQSWTEPLHEYSQFADIIKRLLTYRHQKHVQYEMTKYALETKREQLEDLERSEAEAMRLQSALSGAPRPTGSTIRRSGGKSVLSGEADEEDGSASVPSAPAPSVYPNQRLLPRRKQSNVGLLGALSYSLHGLMDVDPETARRNQLSKTKESISQLEDALQVSAQDLKYASSTIQADLDRFQRQKVADMREMCIAMSKIHQEWCKKNLEAWEEAKREIDKIQLHPNRAPDEEPVVALPNPAAPAPAPVLGGSPPKTPPLPSAANGIER